MGSQLQEPDHADSEEQQMLMEQQEMLYQLQEQQNYMAQLAASNASGVRREEMTVRGVDHARTTAQPVGLPSLIGSPLFKSR